MKMYNIFISHSWGYGDDYYRLINLLDSYPYFNYKDYSIPKDDPIHNARTSYELENAIYNKMKYASVVLVLAGVYSTHSTWIQKEIKIAKELGKPIIAVKPFGNEQISSVVRDNASCIVNWNTSSIIQAIRNYSI